ncbi:serine/threonine-protein kinase [Nocardia sp. NPDC127579]|uniref:serine/threonine-protein kinase n=1 Tax=Nocardia sp. NPDC127579 TaxID=3345402 RepID=UPI003644BA7F
MLEPGDVFAGYTIERLLGRGGMGSVYLARHPRLPRQTALKLLSRELYEDEEIRARFEREADLVAQLDHPNIVTVFDRGVEDEQLWISMQYIDGIDASSVDPAKLPPQRAVQIIAETAAALDYAHRMNVLHRDVKPANILLARGSGRERVLLTDFGIARPREDTKQLTQTGTFTATLAYAAPEQLTGAQLDDRTDQYSLACTLFWLLSGSVPFDSPHAAAVIQGHLQQPPPPVSSLRADLPAGLDQAIGRALAKRPADRYGSCVEFAAEVQRVLSGGSGQRPATGPTPMPMPVAAHTPHPMPIAQPLTGQQSQPQYQQPRPTAGPMPQAGFGPQGGYPTGYQQGGYHPQQPQDGMASNMKVLLGVLAGVIVLVLIALIWAAAA